MYILSKVIINCVLVLKVIRFSPSSGRMAEFVSDLANGLAISSSIFGVIILIIYAIIGYHKCKETQTRHVMNADDESWQYGQQRIDQSWFFVFIFGQSMVIVMAYYDDVGEICIMNILYILHEASLIMIAKYIHYITIIGGSTYHTAVYKHIIVPVCNQSICNILTFSLLLSISISFVPYIGSHYFFIGCGSSIISNLWMWFKTVPDRSFYPCP